MDETLYLEEVKKFININDDIVNININEICLLFKKQIASYSEINSLISDLFLDENNNIEIDYDEIGTNKEMFINISNFLITKMNDNFE
jgi:hypothetical protein